MKVRMLFDSGSLCRGIVYVLPRELAADLVCRKLAELVTEGEAAPANKAMRAAQVHKGACDASRASLHHHHGDRDRAGPALCVGRAGLRSRGPAAGAGLPAGEVRIGTPGRTAFRGSGSDAEKRGAA